MRGSRKKALIIGSITAAAALMAATAVAAKPDNEFLPGWGFGDPNHIHIGPPGQSIRADLTQSDGGFVIRIAGFTIKFPFF